MNDTTTTDDSALPSDLPEAPLPSGWFQGLPSASHAGDDRLPSQLSDTRLPSDLPSRAAKRGF